ncbi:MAG: MBOAT family O-acyltransferase [Bacteroidales bacterium]
MDLFPGIFTYSEDAPLLFTRIYFWGFFLVLLLFYSLIYKKNPWRNAYLLIMSLFFYYKSGGYFFSLLIISTIADFTLGHLIYRARTGFLKKLFLVVSVTFNLGLLAWFKYAYFLTGFFNQITGLDLAVINYPSLLYNQYMGGTADISVIILPVGISFYTFQTISYTVDVYRQKLKPVGNIVDFGFYVSFFPQLVAGPIVRASEFIPQLYTSFRLSIQEMGHAWFLIMSGLVKKILISDYISANYVDMVFNNPASFTGFENLMAVYGYSVQIYCDFSGYTDIAIGVALLLGFKLPVNFNSPYKADNIADFWRRWHISLSSWLRDYLYIPLGGNRRGSLRTYANLLVTMILGGLWHGASLRFIIWGGLHGIALAAHKFSTDHFRGKKRISQRETTMSRFFSVFITFQFVSFTWLFFRSESISSAFVMMNRIWNEFGIEFVPQILYAYSSVFLLMLFALVVHWLPAGFKEWYRGIYIRTHILVKIVFAVLMVFLFYQFRSAGIQPFIYFQF